MISSFTPCLNFITGSTSNGVTTPTQNCCDSLKSLMSTSMDCACLVITANVPLQLPINRTLSLSLPRACNMGGVPVQCKGPAALFGPAPAPIADSPLSPRVAPAAETDTTEDLTPASPPVESDAPTSPGISPALTPPPSPSASRRSCIPPPSLLLFFVGISNFKRYY
ncbi:AAI domain-containing protein [Citrus sinensis]|nr:AAI domain-containing protein [Citrus sinensis]